MCFWSRPGSLRKWSEPRSHSSTMLSFPGKRISGAGILPAAGGWTFCTPTTCGYVSPGQPPWDWSLDIFAPCVSANGAAHTSLGQRPRSGPERCQRAESPPHALASSAMGWSVARWRWMERAFSPGNSRAPLPWGVAPGWYEAAPLALGCTCRATITSGVRLKVSGMHIGTPVPEGHPTIARRFNAGEARNGILVPKGRLRTLLALSRPFGTDPRFRAAHPALKRRAILGSPFGAKKRRQLTDTFNRTLISKLQGQAGCLPSFSSPCKRKLA